MLKQFLYTVFPLIILDSIWLSTMKAFYVKQLGQHMNSGVNLIPVVLFYLLYTIGIIILIIAPAIAGNFSLGKVFLYGALLGLLAYGAYDLTNQATLKNWSTLLSVIDMGWGTLLTGMVSVVSVWLMRIW